MKQRVILHEGRSELTIAAQDLPSPAAGEVLIAVAAFGINRPDLLQRSGQYPPPTDASPLLGLEVAGTVIACGPGTSPWQPGDRVCALVNGGGYSDHCLAPATQCLPWPAHYSAVEAACLPEALFTVWHNLFERGQLQAGQTVLIQGGSSGIGTTAIQLARLAGARVFTTAGTTAKCARCVALGAELAIDYSREDFVEPLLQATAQRGIDVILDILGGEVLARHVRLAAVDGHIINIAVLQGARCEFNLASLMLKRLTLTGSTLRAQSASRKAAIATAIRQQAWPWIDSGAFRPVIDSVFGFDEVELAHQRMQARAHVGKIAIQITE